MKHVERDSITSLPREGGGLSSIVELQRILDPRLRGERNGFNTIIRRINITFSLYSSKGLAAFMETGSKRECGSTGSPRTEVN